MIICSGLDFYMSSLKYDLILGTWTSAWASPCWSPSSPWSTDQCPGSAGPLHFSSYSGLFYQIFSLTFLWRCEGMGIWWRCPFPHTQVVSTWESLWQYILDAWVVCPSPHFWVETFLCCNQFITLHTFLTPPAWPPLPATGSGSSTSSTSRWRVRPQRRWKENAL